MTRQRGSSLPWVTLLAEVLKGTPKLSEASCRNRAGLFDAEEGEHQVRRARSICLACPCLESCREWADSQRHLIGVVAGRHHAYWEDQRRSEKRRAAQ